MKAASYTFEIGCPVCGSDLVHVNSSSSCQTQTCAIALCPRCKREVTITVQAVMRCRPFPVCGTMPGYSAHLSAGTDPCDECMAVKIADVARYRAKVNA